MEFGDMECMKEQSGQLIVARGDRTIEPEVAVHSLDPVDASVPTGRVFAV